MMNEMNGGPRKPPALQSLSAKQTPPAPAPEPEAPPKEQGVSITPEMVCFRDEAEKCGGCTHMGADGQCAVLNMAVAEGDSCNAFTSGASEEPAEPVEVE